jgi:exopolysaccharide biosynthesis polyprenyl glycosylphosphotransferase
MPPTLSFHGPGLRLGRLRPTKLESCLAIVGSPERTSIAARRIGGIGNGFRIEVFSDRVGPGKKAGRAETDIDRLTKLVNSGHIDRVLLATPVEEQERIAAVVRQLEGIAADVGIIVPEGVSTDMHLEALGGVYIAPVLKRPLTPFQQFVKSAMDRVCALLLLLLIAPFLLSIALLVGVTSSGPILFRQQRRGLNNKTFEVLKFRTLYNSCADPNASQPVERHDKRVTSIGKVLRALSLDELPQLLNVLKGDMSLIGPRPLPVDLKVEGRLCSEFPRYGARHRVRPGITGLAQVKGSRGGMEVTEHLQQRIAYDLEYINNYSLLLDAKIVIATVFVVLGRSNAY